MNVSTLKHDCQSVRFPWWRRLQAKVFGIDLDDCRQMAVTVIANNVKLSEMELQEAIGRCRDAANAVSFHREQEFKRGRSVGFGPVWIRLLMFVIELILRQYFTERK